MSQVENAPETAIENYDKRSVRLLTLSLYSTTLIFVALIALTVIITNDYAREAIWFGFAWPITLQSLVLIVKWERTRCDPRLTVSSPRASFTRCPTPTGVIYSLSVIRCLPLIHVLYFTTQAHHTHCTSHRHFCCCSLTVCLTLILTLSVSLVLTLTVSHMHCLLHPVC